jgi:HD superfamily phosphodiesterase
MTVRGGAHGPILAIYGLRATVRVRSLTSTVGVMQAVLTLPSGPLAEACVSLARKTESLPIVDHSIRSFLYARLLAEHEDSLADAAYDEGLLFAACILHDLGLGTGALGKARFEVEGADLAAALLSEYGVAARDIDRVWEAIARTPRWGSLSVVDCSRT